MMPAVLRFLSVAVFLGALLVGCDTRTEQAVDDSAITAAVKAKLAAEQAATLTGVNVDTHQGTVSLSGTVESEATKQRAAALAREVEGVREVVNNLQVQATG